MTTITTYSFNEYNAKHRYILQQALLTYVDNIMRGSFYWNVLRTNVFIEDISDLKVRLTFAFTQSKDKYLKSFRRMGMRKVMEGLSEQLGIKKEYRIDIGFEKVTKTKKDSWNPSIEYGDCYVKYFIPRELYNQLEMLAIIDKGEYIKNLSRKLNHDFL